MRSDKSNGDGGGENLRRESADGWCGERELRLVLKRPPRPTRPPDLGREGKGAGDWGGGSSLRCGGERGGKTGPSFRRTGRPGSDDAGLHDL